MKICYWGTYDRNYPRNQTLIAGLRKNGATVKECHNTLWRNTRDKLSRASSCWLAPGLLFRWLWIYLRLSFRFLRGEKPDFIFVGYSGHFDMFPAALLGRVRGVPVVFDVFLSLYEAFVSDRGVIKPGSLKARLLYLADRYSCALADLALLDTEEHIKYFCRTFNLPASKFRRSFVGANEDFYGVRPVHRPEGPFTVLHFGTYIPLHGINYILRAAKNLERHADISFRLIGSGKEYAPAVKLAGELKLEKVKFIAFKDMQSLLEEIARASVCLGIFGDTEKALRVIPNKVFLSLAAAKPVITGDSPAARELLENGRDCLLCEMGSPEAIAKAVLRLHNDAALAGKISVNGYELFKKKASAEMLGRELLEMIKAWDK